MKKDRQESVRKDPVCGMVLSPRAAVAEGECRNKLKADPERCLRRHRPS